MAEAPAPATVSSDAWLGGRLSLLQPLRGHRVGSDAALLAAAVDIRAGRLVDVGAGVGAVGLAIAARSRSVEADLVEIDMGLAQLAEDNAARNGLAGRVRVLNLDVADARARRKAGLLAEAADAIVTNPPFFDPAVVRVSPNEAKAGAHVFAAVAGAVSPLAAWIRASLACLKSGGRFVMIHRPDALAAILTAAENRLGAVVLLPVYPRQGAAAHRLLISGVKGSRAPLRVGTPLVLHEDSGVLTPEADALHRGELLIDWV